MQSPDQAADGSMQGASTSSTLLRGLRSGDTTCRQEARERFYILYAPLIFRRCLRGGLSSHDAYDITHDVVIKAWQRIASFRKRARTGSFRRWLFTITDNQIRDNLKKHRPSLLGGEMDGLAAPAALRTGADEIAAFAHRLYDIYRETVGSRHRPNTLKAFEAVHFQGQSTAEAARALNMTENAVRIANFRILQGLRKTGEEFFG